MMQWTCLLGDDMLEMSFQQIPSVRLDIDLQLANLHMVQPANGLSDELIRQMDLVLQVAVWGAGAF